MPLRDFHMRGTDQPTEIFERWSANPWDPVAPKTAATVILVRDGAAGVEVFLQRRVGTMAFAPNRYVFPGGGLDAGDADRLPWSGPSEVEWAQILDTSPERAHALVAAAIRELFEEAGVLLATPPAGGAATDPDVLGSARRRLLDRRVTLAQILTELGLVARTDLLGFLAHWLTPGFEPRRYDTYFFSALVPPGQVADAETSEAEHADWVLPSEVLAHPAGLLMPPTMACLERLASASCAEQVVAHRVTVPLVAPVLVRTPDGWAMRAELP
ncbi:MAG: NUDIX hydrolase [Tetrasphaera sp.]